MCTIFIYKIAFHWTQITKSCSVVSQVKQVLRETTTSADPLVCTTCSQVFPPRWILPGWSVPAVAAAASPQHRWALWFWPPGLLSTTPRNSPKPPATLPSSLPSPSSCPSSGRAGSAAGLPWLRPSLRPRGLQHPSQGTLPLSFSSTFSTTCPYDWSFPLARPEGS